MPTFIKTGYWESAVKSYKGWLNLEELINSSGVITGSGTAGRLAFWTAPSVQSATTNLFWDNVNNRLAIGSAPLTADFEINKNSAVFQAYRNINSGTNLTTGAVVYQLDILGQRNGGASSFARSQVVYNGDGITRRGRWIFGVAEASGFGGSSFMLSQTSSSVKIVNIGFNAPQYSDSDTTITTAYAQHATVVVNGQTTLPLMSWDINGFAQNVMFSDGNLALNSTSNLGFKLDVNGTARVSGNMDIGTTTTNPTINFAASANGSTAQFVINNSAFGGTLFTIRNPLDNRYFRITGNNFDISTTGNITGVALASQNITIGSVTSTSIRGFNTATIDFNGDNFIIHSRLNSTAPVRILSGSQTATAKGTVFISDYSNVAGTINASAQLQVDSTVQGFLPPRMTTAQKNAIVSPAAGLVVYDTGLNKLCVFTTGWQTITSA